MSVESYTLVAFNYLRLSISNRMFSKYIIYFKYIPLLT